jgi:flagellar motor switch protein FliN/FliY
LSSVLGITDAAAWLIEEWVSKLAGSVELMTEVRPGLKVSARIPAASPEITDGALWHAIPLNVTAGTVVYLGAPEESWLHIGRSALLAAGVTDVSAEDARSTYLEIVTQATSGLAQAIAGRLGKAVVNLPAKQTRLSEGGLIETTLVNPVDVSLREPPLRKIYVGWSDALVAALTPSKHAEKDPGETDSRALQRGAQQEKSTTLDLLMEVELPVSVSFGRAQLPLRDVLKLNSGSIVELNRTISDPVEIIVNNCVIARGEVVVVEGNYGVRIQHVISREERLRTLK